MIREPISRFFFPHHSAQSSSRAYAHTGGIETCAIYCANGAVWHPQPTAPTEITVLLAGASCIAALLALMLALVKLLGWNRTRYTELPITTPPVSPPCMIAEQEDEPPLRRSRRLTAVRADDGSELPFVPGPSSVGPQVASNRGLFVADGATIDAGTIFKVHISELLSFPRPAPEAPVSIDQWEQAMEGTLSAWISKGYYVIPLDAEGLRRDEPLVFRRSAHTRPQQPPRARAPRAPAER